MAHPLKEFAAEVSEHEWPIAVCPKCRAGTIPYTPVTMFEDPESASRHDHEAWDIDMVFGTFYGSSQCTNPACGQWVVMTGRYRVVENNGEPGYGQYGELFQLKTFDPPLSILELPSAVPTEVAEAVEAAARVVWLDASSAANRLRTAVERILDHQGVRKTMITKKRTRRRLSAHERIEVFELKSKAAADAMMAVKWIGNDGTHESDMSVADVLEGATVLQLALKAVYDKSDAETLKLIKGINKTKGLPKKKRLKAP